MSTSRTNVFTGFITSVLCTGALMAADDLPPLSAYVVVNDQGQLSVDGERIRLWGGIGHFPGKRETIQDDPYFRQRMAIKRAKLMGFNAVRIHHLVFDDTAQKGDLSRTDVVDFFFAEAGRQGMRLWAAGFGGGRLFSEDIEAAADIIDEPETREVWIESMRALLATHFSTGDRLSVYLGLPPVVWDPRLEAITIDHMRRKAQHVNVHTGRRHADDPTIAVWELNNEQWWMRRMTSGQWQTLPPFLRESLIARWNAWLMKKYGDEAALTAAWGFLFPGESLADGSVLLAPMAKAMTAVQLNDTNPEALAAFKTIEGPIGREDCTAQRSSDVLAFFMDTLIAHKQRFAAELKSWGRSCELSPLIYDTGIGESIQSQYLHQHADAVAQASYMEGMQIEMIKPDHKRWPFYSMLDLPPQMCNDVPWLEHNRFPGKPYLVYETQFGSPSKYRAEWPARLVALGAIQDWDAACWHYWALDDYDYTKEEPYTGKLAAPGRGAYQYVYTFDEVEFALMRASSAVFRNGLLQPAATPTTFTYGKSALLDPRSMDYGGAYGRTGLMDMMTTTYTHGVRLIIDPTQEEFVKVDGPMTRFNGYERPSPLQPTPEIEIDYQRGHLRFDAPGVAGYVGFLGQLGADHLTFANGVTVRDIVHHDPPGTPYPAGDERFLATILASEDGKPLTETTQAVLALVASSFNTGLNIQRDPPKVVSYGTTPVLVTRVSATVEVPALIGARWRMIDFNERELATGTIGEDGILKVPSDLPVFLTLFER